ncbi:MAG: hypothetical protein G01um10147_650 [Microgenomates group bacterium Gr01-1014_7]|nr:MAG: hypothetical protein G01um10147_650 [Microgenomates group bacterium Gr01-1014_7]
MSEFKDNARNIAVIIALAPPIIVATEAFVLTGAINFASRKLEKEIRERGLVKGLIKATATASLLPVVAAALTYIGTGNSSLAVAAGSITLFAEANVVGAGEAGSHIPF